MNKLVSTIITTCNRFDLFKIALTSVQNQTYQETEIIVVDGSDINAIQNYIKQYPNIIYVNHKSKHPNVLRNIGIECASGELLAFLDDDDMWENDKLALQVQCLENSNIGLCYTGKNILNSNNNKIKYSYHTAKFKSDSKSIMWDNFIGTTSSIMVRKDVILDVDCFDEQLPALQDYDLYIRICQKYKVQGINQNLVRYLDNHANNQISKNKNNFGIACQLLKKKYKQLPNSAMLSLSLSKIKLKRKMKGWYE